MRNTFYLEILKYLIENYDDNSKFYMSDLEEAGYKYTTIDMNLKLIVNKFENFFLVDKKRSPFEYTLLDRAELIKAVIKEEIPDFLQDYIIINIKSISQKTI